MRGVTNFTARGKTVVVAKPQIGFVKCAAMLAGVAPRQRG
jgi:hypothetical protein